MDDVESFFKGYGDIESISLKPGYGFITMSHRRDAERIVKNLDGEKMAGEKVDIQHAKAGQSGSSKANNYRRLEYYYWSMHLFSINTRTLHIIS